MKLTNANAWRTFAGGTAAAKDRYGYDADTTIGRYMINPVSRWDNSQQHLGYTVFFLNDKGKLPGSTMHVVKGSPIPLLETRGLCQEHMEVNGGEIVPTS